MSKPSICSRARRASAVLLLVLGLPAGTALAAQSHDRLAAGPSEPVCQVVGETDRRSGAPVKNATETRAGLWGTDLGIPVEHAGKLYVFFGDSHPTPDIQRPRDADPIAVTVDTAGDDCLDLDFLVDADGGFRPLAVPGIPLGEYGVPTGGVSVGERLFVFASTDFTPENKMGRTVLASSDDGGRTFVQHRTISAAKFINISAHHADAMTLPGFDGEAVLLWGSGRYRQSDPYLAVVPAAGFADLDGIRYFRGVDPETGEPDWTADEADAAPLFDQPCIGELSVAWNAPLGRWLMTYNCDTPGLPAQIHVRAAPHPWGPWSDAAVLLDAPQGYAQCLINPPVGVAAGCGVSDPGNAAVVGGPYGPYMIERFFTAAAGGSEIYYLLSTWNPYTVVLMRATVRIQ